jgi:signal transduction histidine kinase
VLVAALCFALATIAVGWRTAKRYRGLLEGIDAIAFEYLPATDHVRYVAPQITRMVGTANYRELLGELIHPEDRQRVRDAVHAYANGATTARIEYRLLCGDGVVRVRTLLGDRSDGIVRGLMIDTTRQNRQETERQLETVGRLAGGVAHEINTPTQFTQDSLQFVREAITELARAIERHPEARDALAADAAADLEYVLANVPLALDRATAGLERISTIVSSLRELALPETDGARTTVDLGDVLGDTLSAARAEYANICEITTSFAELPRVAGNRNELRRVFLNLLGNAARSVGDTSRRGTITVTTSRDGDHVAVAFADTGTGIPLEIRHLVFEPFFTTREIGKARGQGLAVSRAVIARHGGTLAFETLVGAGTTFTIRLPIAVAIARAA